MLPPRQLTGSVASPAVRTRQCRTVQCEHAKRSSPSQPGIRHRRIRPHQHQHHQRYRKIRQRRNALPRPIQKAIAQHVISDWNRTLDETVSEALAAGPRTSLGEKLAAIFTSLARQIAEDTNVRAGMKLTLEPTIDKAAGFAHWVDAISDIIETAITTGELTNTLTTHRLAWNLCVGTIGAAHAAAALGEDIDITVRIEDIVAAHLRGTLG